MKKFHFAPTTVYGPKSSGTIPLLSADESTLIPDIDDILERWTDHFNRVRNRQSTINANVINRLPHIEYDILLDEYPNVTEIRKQYFYFLFVLFIRYFKRVHT